MVLFGKGVSYCTCRKWCGEEDCSFLSWEEGHWSRSTPWSVLMGSAHSGRRLEPRGWGQVDDLWEAV